MKSVETYTHLESFPTSIGALKSFQQKLQHGEKKLITKNYGRKGFSVFMMDLCIKLFVRIYINVAQTYKLKQWGASGIDFRTATF